MQVTTYTINGKLYTVIMPDDIEAFEIKESDWFIDWRGYHVAINRTCEGNEYIVAHALPALPRNPKPEDAALLYRYASEGLFVCMGNGEVVVRSNGVIVFISDGDFEITHCLDTQRNRVEVAIV